MLCHDGQLALVDDQHVDQREQIGGQGLRRRGVQDHLEALIARRAGIGRYGRHGCFELQQQVAEAVQRGQVGRAQRQVGAGRHRDRVFRIVRNADEGGAGGLVRHAHDVALHAGGQQGLLERHSVGIVAERQQHVRRHRAGARSSDRLVGALAAGIGLEIAPEHGLARGRDVRGANNKVEIGGAGDKDHGRFRSQAANAGPVRPGDQALGGT